MKDESMVNEQIVNEVVELRQKIVELEVPQIGTREAEELYQILAEKSFAGVYVVQDSTFRFINSNAAAYAGYTQVELTGKTSISIVHPEDREMVRKKAKKMLRGESTFPYEFRIITKDGYTRWIMETVTSINYSGKPAVLGNSMDITESKISEESLRESEEKYRTILESIQEGYFEVDLVGNLTFFNDSLCEIVGYPRDELLNMNNRDYTTPETARKTYQLFNSVYRTGEPAKITDYEVFAKDGRTLVFELSTSLIQDRKNRPIGFRGVVRDTTDRKRVEEALRESEERFRTLVENMNETFYMIDEKGVITYVSPVMESFGGYKPSEVIGRPFTDFVFHEDMPGRIRQFQKIKAGINEASEYRYVAKTGEKLWIKTAPRPIIEKGRVIGVQGILTDITDIKKAEEEKRELEASLHQARKMESIGTLAGGIAHDFNNLLMGMQGNISLMLLDTDFGHPNYKKLKTIEQHVQSGAELTSQLLGFARGGKYEVKPTDLNSLVRKTSEMFGRTKKEVTIHEKYQKDIWTVDADQGQMEQVLLNLYVNAWQAMPKGGELYLQTENVTLDKKYAKLRNVEPGNYAKISVTDTGTGMDEATRQKIFDPFFTSKKMGSVKGTGLGLASAYGIIKNHGGIIDVYSKKGAGSTFNIYLPASEEVISDRETEIGKEQIPTGHETVLFVDDEDMIIDVGKDMLKTLGYEVLTVRSGREAIEIYKENQDRIDIVIMDMIMPDMGGGEAYDRLKEINPDIKVLLSSGYSITGQATEILNRGCNGFIQKPFNLKDLSQEIRGILEDKQDYFDKTT